jgi:YegS/Rv2252/BmrU family lipid kinase
MPLSITLIVRPREGDERIAELRGAVAELRLQGHQVLWRDTLHAGDAERFARAAARRRADLIVAAGGDGTLNEVVNGIARSWYRPRVGVVPVGTANDFALGIGLPESAGDALQVALDGEPTQIDLAKVSVAGASARQATDRNVVVEGARAQDGPPESVATARNPSRSRFFINVSTGGFGAQATENTDPDTKRKLGALAYLISGIKQFVAYRPTRARFVTDAGLLHDGDFLVFAVGNSRQTGGGQVLTPRADLSDGKLDVVLVPEISRMDFLALLPDLRAGTHLDSPDVKYVQTRTLRIDAHEEISVNIDGEPMPAASFRYAVHSQPITIMLPKTSEERGARSEE